MRKLTALIFVLCLSLGVYAQSLYFPPATGDEWDTLSPETLGWCVDRIDSMYDFLEQNNTRAFIVLKDGKIVMEKYFGTFTRDSVWYWASAGKTLTTFLIGMAQQEGYLSIKDTTADYLGRGWTACTGEDEEKITIFHQLTMTTGLDDGVPDPDCTDSNCLVSLTSAGNRWAYHNAPYTLLDEVLKAATGKDRNIYLAQKLNGTGISGLFFPIGYNGVFFSKPRSMARFGLFMLNRGDWNGNRIMTDTHYFNNMVNTSQSLNRSYGYLWWLNGKTSFMIPQSQFVFAGMLSPHAPDDMFSALGKNGQILNVVPDMNLVMVRMGDAPSEGSGLITPLFNDRIWEEFNKVMCTGSSIEQEENPEPIVRLFPNPAIDKLKVISPEKIRLIQIISMDGSIIFEEKVNVETIDLNVEGLELGLYIIRLQSEKAIVNRMFIRK